MKAIVTFIVGFVGMLFVCMAAMVVAAQSMMQSGDVHSVWALEHEGLEDIPDRDVPVAVEVE